MVFGYSHGCCSVYSFCVITGVIFEFCYNRCADLTACVV